MKKSLKKDSVFILPKNFKELLSFFYTEDFETEKGFGRFKVDFYSEALGLAFEYDGVEHYSVIQKIYSDKRKDALLFENGIRLIRWPYYFMPTSDTCKFIFKDAYTEKKLNLMLKTMFKIESENEMVSPGFHGTTNIPANFIWPGIERFLQEISLSPQSIQLQVRRSLKIYCEKKVDGNVERVFPTYHDGFMRFMAQDD